MTQDERWQVRYNEVKNFIEREQGNSFKYYGAGKWMVYFLKRNRRVCE